MTIRSAFSRVVLPLTCLALSGSAPRAGATVPDPRFSTTDLVVVGNTTGTPMGGLPAGYDVTVRDLNNVPKAGSVVTLDFSAAGMKVYSTQNAGTTINCAARTISRTTDAVGHVNFGARIAGHNNSNSVAVSADGVPLAAVKARSTDLDGADGKTGLGDLALFSANLLNNTSAQETDFDLNGTTGLSDLGLISSELLSLVTGSYCP
jgi:hypothetical protein